MHGVSLYHQPICLCCLKEIEGWITADKSHIVFASPLAGDTLVLHSHVLSYCGLLVAADCAVYLGHYQRSVYKQTNELAVLLV